MQFVGHHLKCNTLQALLITALASDALESGCLYHKNAQEHQALDIALQGRQWYAVQLLVTAGQDMQAAFLDILLQDDLLSECRYAANQLCF